MMKTGLTGVMFALASAGALAHDGTVDISGSIKDNSCTVSPQTIDQPVDLGNIASKAFTQVGSTSLPVAFFIDLQNCGAAATGVTLTFNGTVSDANPDLLALSDGAGNAQGVGVAIMDAQRTTLPINSKSGIYTLDPALQNNRLDFYAQYRATAMPVTAGAANATATFSLTYQ